MNKYITIINTSCIDKLTKIPNVKIPEIKNDISITSILAT